MKLLIITRSPTDNSVKEISFQELVKIVMADNDCDQSVSSTIDSIKIWLKSPLSSFDSCKMERGLPAFTIVRVA